MSINDPIIDKVMRQRDYMANTSAGIPSLIVACVSSLVAIVALYISATIGFSSGQLHSGIYQSINLITIAYLLGALVWMICLVWELFNSR